MHRLFVSAVPEGNKVVLRDAGQIHHLRDVLRLENGDAVILCDHAGGEYDCVISRMSRGEMALEVKARRAAASRRASLAIVCAIPKGDRMDDVVDKVTQLGVDRIVPLRAARGIVDLDDDVQPVRLDRWRRLARAAAQQSQRSTVPVIAAVADLDEVVRQSVEFELKLILTLLGERRPLRAALAGSGAQSIMVMVGPEGDFTPGEVARAVEAGFIPVSLGSRVLRVETAAIATAAYVSLSLSL